MSIDFLIIEKTGIIKEIKVKFFSQTDLYKKCGYRKPDNFICHTTWNNIKIENNKYIIQLWGRENGKPDNENKYEFPPPVDKKLFFGNCALIRLDNQDNKKLLNITKNEWIKIYEKLYGGFETTSSKIKYENDDEDDEEEDEDELDELNIIKKEMKTKKEKYVKDGFAVDSNDENDVENEDECDDVEEDEPYEEYVKTISEKEDKPEIGEYDIDNISIGSELQEELYSYSSDYD